MLSKENYILNTPSFSNHSLIRMAQRGVQTNAVTAIIQYSDQRVHVGSELKSLSISRKKIRALIQTKQLKPSMAEKLTNLCVVVANENTEIAPMIVTVVHPSKTTKGRAYYKPKGYEPIKRRKRKR